MFGHFCFQDMLEVHYTIQNQTSVAKLMLLDKAKLQHGTGSLATDTNSKIHIVIYISPGFSQRTYCRRLDKID